MTDILSNGPKRCPYCGLQNPPSQQICDCGYDFAKPEPGASKVARDLGGIGGWLLVLCIWLVVWKPIGFLLVIYRLGYGAALFQGLYPDILVMFIFACVDTGGALYSGISLWRQNPGAVFTGKAYFIGISIALLLAKAALLLTIGRSEPSFLAVLGRLALNAVCYLYLCDSKRVRANFAIANSR